MTKKTERNSDKAWQDYIDFKGILFDQPTYVVNADDLKRITGQEPRNLAKFDTPNQLPKPLATAGYTLFPVRNGQYQLVSGSLFIDVPNCDNREEFKPLTPFPLITEGRGHSESQYIDQAYNSGLLNHFLGLVEMYQTIRGREYTKRFTFQWAGSQVEVESVQIEVDSGYESLQEIVLIEAKIGIPHHFNVRQLYYPYRHFSMLAPKKRIRTLFLGYDIPTTTFHLYEYQFRNEKDPLSGFVSKCNGYRITPPVHLSIHQLIDTHFQSASAVVPQADDLNKIYEIAMLVEAGKNHAHDIAEYFGFDPRQSSYYREAAEYLGLLTSDPHIGYALTEQGMALLSEPISTQATFLAKTVVNSWIFVELILRSGRGGSFTDSDIESVISTAKKHDGSSLYGGTTVSRRRQTIVAWIRWLAQEIKCFTISNGTYQFR